MKMFCVETFPLLCGDVVMWRRGYVETSLCGDVNTEMSLCGDVIMWRRYYVETSLLYILETFLWGDNEPVWSSRIEMFLW